MSKRVRVIHDTVKQLTQRVSLIVREIADHPRVFDHPAVVLVQLPKKGVDGEINKDAIEFHRFSWLNLQW